MTELPLESLAVVLPCRNEEESLPGVVAEALRHAGPLAGRLEIIVVDDGSTDRTAEVAEALARAHAEVRLVRHARGKGYGGALRSGFAASTAGHVFYTDGDGQFDLAQLPRLLAVLREADVAAGYRERRVEGVVRRFNGWAWTRLVCAVFGFEARDVDCAFKVFPGEFLRGAGLVSNGALISAELLARAKRAGLRTGFVGVGHRPRTGGRPTGASPRVIFRAFVELSRLAKVIRGERGTSGA